MGQGLRGPDPGGFRSSAIPAFPPRPKAARRLFILTVDHHVIEYGFGIVKPGEVKHYCYEGSPWVASPDGWIPGIPRPQTKTTSPSRGSRRIDVEECPPFP